MVKMMIQYFTESGSFSNPMPDDFEIVTSKKAAMAAARAWFSEVSDYSDAPSSVRVFYWEPEDDDTLYPCDRYPDAIIEQGKRGGAVWCKL